jgi:hypothetical protein
VVREKDRLVNHKPLIHLSLLDTTNDADEEADDGLELADKIATIWERRTSVGSGLRALDVSITIVVTTAENRPAYQ